ncbi:MAG: type III pantothenate kinase [Fibrobacter sp.]|nr:type III pantothenate kinase [Fibrobacter sp.]MCQ2122045.1 type III pantothenate kinase [Fibrobacter sp.]
MAKKSQTSQPYSFVVDVGNTHTVLGIYKGDKVVDHWRLTTRKETTSDEVMNRIGGLIRFSDIKPEKINYVGLSTVVPVLERPWTKALQALLKRPVQVVNSDNCLNCPIAYPNPKTLGADRLCNIIALRNRGYKNAIVVDMGTATTFDVMKNGGFAGGAIIPGISASLDVLTEKAARLLPVSIEWPSKVIADNTDDAIRSGLMYGFMAELETLVAKIKAELGVKNVPVFATGGWGKMVVGHTKCIDTYDPYLTLDGVRLVAIYGNVAAEFDRENEED